MFMSAQPLQACPETQLDDTRWHPVTVKAAVNGDFFAKVAGHIAPSLKILQNLPAWIAEDMDAFTARSNATAQTSLEGVTELSRRVERIMADSAALMRLQDHTHLTHRICPFDSIQRVFQERFPEGPAILELSGDNSHLWLDPVLFEAIVGELITNAIVHHNKPTATVTCTVSRTSTALEVTVRDDGPGVPGPDLDRVFHAFERLDRSTEADTSGLGLTRVLCAAEKMEATVAIASHSVRRGTGVRVTFPLRR